MSKNSGWNKTVHKSQVPPEVQPTTPPIIPPAPKSTLPVDVLSVDRDWLDMWGMVWSWTVVGAVVALLFGGGISAMTSGRILLADAFFAFAFFLFSAKWLTWARLNRRRSTVIAGIAVAAVIVSCSVIGNHLSNPSVQLSVTPEEATVASSEWHDVEEITVANNGWKVAYSPWFIAKPSDSNIDFTVLPLSGPGSDAGNMGLILDDHSVMCPIIHIAPHGYVIFRVDSHLRKPASASRLSFTVLKGSPAADKRTRRTYK